jgi:hypothetical protein
MLSMNRIGVLVLVSVATAGGLLAQYPDGPIPNWTVPPYRGTSASGGLSTMTDISPGIAFVAMSPCRVFDTRGANGPYGGPRLLANTTRNFDIDSGPCTGIPTGVDAYSMNFGAILPDGANSFVTIWPTGSAQPLVSSINPIQGGVVANAAIVPAGTGGQISVFPNTGLHLYGDINGYFTDRYNPGVSFHAVSSTVAPAILAENTSTAATAVALQAVITSTSAGDFATAIAGRTNGNGYGVHGSSANGYGVLAGGGTGGVWAQTPGTIAGSAGVYGSAVATDARNYGVFGETEAQEPAAPGDPALCAAGVYGRSGADTISCSTSATQYFGPYGVLATSSLTAVLGLGQFRGIQGCQTDGAGTPYHCGLLGNHNAGVHSYSDITAGGTKHFIEPHPRDPSKQIKYASLEGNEVGTYFRGRGKFRRGLAVIEVPEDFRLVTDPEGLSIQVTPIAEMATVAVVSLGLDRIVVKGSRDVEFFYTVNGIRHNYRDFRAVEPNMSFVPRSGDDRMAEWPETHRRMLVQNGTLRGDGSVNLETARRIGWDKAWEKRERPAPEPTTE